MHYFVIHQHDLQCSIILAELSWNTLSKSEISAGPDAFDRWKQLQATNTTHNIKMHAHKIQLEDLWPGGPLPISLIGGPL